MSVITVTNTNDNGHGTPAIEGSLRDAIQNAKSGDTIVFDSSLAKQTINLKRNLEIKENITIDAKNAEGLTLSGKESGLIIAVIGDGREFTVRNLNIVDGFHGYNGAAIRVMDDNAKITVEDSEFNNNTAGQGAAIWARNNAEVTVLDSKFDGNKATETYDSAAGAISVFENSKLTVKGSDFTNNKGQNGGAIGTIFTELTVEDSTFRNNESVEFGGAIHNDGASVPNQPRYYSGSLPRDPQGGQTIIRDSSFIDNSAKGSGGGVSIWGYDQDFVTIEGSKFVDNQVNQDNNGDANGGAIRVSGKQVTIKDSTIADNTSALEGGGLWYQGESQVKISNTEFLNNSAKEGGAINSQQWKGPGTDIDQTKFENNQAPEGGAIYKENRMPVDIDDSTFVNNSSKFGGDTNNITIDDVPLSPLPQSVSTPPVNQMTMAPGEDTIEDSQQESYSFVDRKNQTTNSLDVGDTDTINDTFDPILGSNSNTKTQNILGNNTNSDLEEQDGAYGLLGNGEDRTIVGTNTDNLSPDSSLLDDFSLSGLDNSLMTDRFDLNSLELIGQNYSLGATDADIETGLPQDLSPGQILEIADSLRTSFDGILDTLKMSTSTS